MNRFEALWLPLFPSEKPRTTRLLLKNAMAISAWLGATLHVVVAEPQSEATRAWLDAQTQRNRRLRTLLFPVAWVGENFLHELMRVIQSHPQSILLLGTDRAGFLGLSQGLSDRKMTLLEHCSFPVWILPAHFRLTPTLLRSILVPMSGEKRGSRALELAIQLGNSHGIPVDILHVTSSAPESDGDESLIGHVTDQIHHEYPALVEELIVQATPYADPYDRLVIRNFHHCYGDVAQKLREWIGNARQNLLIFEWKGIIKEGRAKKIRLLLKQAEGPILLVREDSHAKSHLRTGRQFGAAR